MRENEQLRKKIATLEKEKRFSLERIADSDQKTVFYTGFPSYNSLKACFCFLGPAVNQLNYWDPGKARLATSHNSPSSVTKKGRTRTLPPLEEFFLVLVRLRLGLFEQDLADRFGISSSTVSRICRTWLTFLYLKFKEIPLWPPKEVVQGSMPSCFREAYPTTRVIIDATEIFIEKPSLPELQQMTFSSYKNTNTFKGLIGISPAGVITFVSKLFPGSISDKQITRRSGLLQLLKRGDSVMADRGFEIQDELTLIGVRLNIPPFLRGKTQLSEEELVETRRIASVRIHVERAMERIKNFHIFDRTIPQTLTDIAEQIFFVCAILSNFQPPLCS